MKKNVIFTSSILLLILFSFEGIAQQGGGGSGRRYKMEPKEMAERQTNQMKETLVLTADQLPKIEALNLKYAEKMKTARDEANGDRDAMRSTMMEMLKEKDSELKNILTAGQYTKWQEWRKEAREKGRQRRGI